MWYDDLPSDTKLPFPSAEEKGRRVRRWWPLDRKWYTGTVTRRYHYDAVHTLVEYDDGEKRYENLSKGRWRDGDGNEEDEQPPSSDGESDDGWSVDASDEETPEEEVEEVEVEEVEVEVEVEVETEEEEAVKTEPMAVPLLQIRPTKFFERWADEMSSQICEHAPSSPATEHRLHHFARRGRGNMSPAAAQRWRPRPSPPMPYYHPHRPHRPHRPHYQISGLEKRLRHKRNAKRLHARFGVCGFHCLHTYVLAQREGIRTPTCHKPKAATGGGCEAGSHDKPKGLMQWAYANLEPC